MPNPIILKPTLLSNSTWVLASGPIPTGGGTSKFYYLKSYANYWLCSVNSDGSGAKKRVAKPSELLCSNSGDTLFGVAFTYAYPHNTGTDALYGIYRVSTRTSDSHVEYQGVFPEPQAGYVIEAVTDDSTTDLAAIVIEAQDHTDNGDVTTGDPVTYRDVTAAARAWTAFSDQSYGH